MLYDWSGLHAILEELPEGHWTTYGSLAAAIGTASQAVGNHLPQCPQCANGYRVLKCDGTISPGFVWTDADDNNRDPVAVLQEEGLAFVDSKADPERELREPAVLELVGTSSEGSALPD
ncbi:MGMT family protein [Cellulomonas sp. PhB143]|uniref:MGMT family protein n=1 Tax=Cellulomonas sp. PhB143 TaxID=2485186 RepID=UPI0011CE7E8D|nr:MGMT family protein [Cellulomonas sp. PhB143]